MMITTYANGYKIYTDNGHDWFYADSGLSYNKQLHGDRKICPACKLSQTKEGYDGCLGKLEGVRNACCGHGHSDFAYVEFENGKVLKYADAIKYFESISKQPIE